MIAEKTLRKWRKDALKAAQQAEFTEVMFADTSPRLAKAYLDDQQKILRMTQELLDQYLINK